MAEPAAKKAKTEEAPVIEAPPPEVEADAKEIKKASALDGQVVFNVQDTTLNFMTTPAGPGGHLLKALSEGGFANLLAGARSNVGVKSGRHMFEVKIVEAISPADGSKGGQQGARQVLKVGFSTQGGSLFLGDGDDSICFDMDGGLWHDKKRTAGKRWAREAVIAVVLNLDKKSPNANTVSVFNDGVRMCQPQALPEALKGKTLFPTLTFRNVTAHVNFGPEPVVALPFKCHMIQGMEKPEAEVAPVPEVPKDGKYEVLYPIGLPDEGPFDWLDTFLKKNPKYTEISGRSILSWADKSGFVHPAATVSKDSSEVIAALEGDYRRILQHLAPLQKRDFVIMDLKTNLTKDGRAKALQVFSSAGFKKVATVVMGDPTPDFGKHVRSIALQDKQAAADLEFKIKREAEKRKLFAEKKQKQAEKGKRKAEKLRLSKAEQIKKKADIEKKKKAGETVTEEEEKAAAEPEPVEESEDEPEEAAPMDEDPPKVELSEEEKKLKFYKGKVPDMSQIVMATTFTKFSVPVKDEGFDEIRYPWSKGPACEEYLQKWLSQRKLTTRVEDIAPSAWFAGKQGQWMRTLKEWEGKQIQYKGIVNKRENDKKAKAQKKIQLAAKAEADKKKKEAEKEKAKAEGKTVEEEKEEAKAPEEDEKEEEHEDENVDFDSLDVFSVDNVCDLGGGLPIFKNFLPEDWTMAALRFELYILVHAFKHDSVDSDRKLIHVDHLGFYYNKYFKKTLAPKAFGVETMTELVGLITDTVFVTEQGTLRTFIPEELESLAVFAKITEEQRRHRTLRLESGDESARLKVPNMQNQQKHGDGGGKRHDGGAKWNQQGGQQKQHQDKWGGQSSGGGDKWGGGGGGGGGKQSGGDSWGGNKWQQSGGGSWGGQGGGNKQEGKKNWGNKRW